MIEGIEVLNQIEVTTEPIWAIVLCIISTILIFASLCVGFYSVENDKETLGNAMFITFVLSAISTFFFVILLGTIKVPTGEYHYQVVIDDSVSMVKFTEKYEIVEINGKIYTIKEKE